jgi:predicted dehydrogenase
VRFETDLALDLKACEAVAICSKTSQHPELVERSAAAGKAGLCEKLIATDMAGGDRLAAVAANSGVTNMQSFLKRLEPVSYQLRHRLMRVCIHLVRIRHGHGYGRTEDFKQRCYIDPPLAGGGALLDARCTGSCLPESVNATTSRATLQLEVEDSGLAGFSYARHDRRAGRKLRLWAADSSIEVYGTHGMVLVSGVDLALRDTTPSGFIRSYGSGRRKSLALAPRSTRVQGRTVSPSKRAHPRALPGDGATAAGIGGKGARRAADLEGQCGGRGGPAAAVSS